MNASLRKKMTVGVAALGCVGAGGCGGAFAAGTEAASPIAPRVQAIVDANRRYPRWADFPATPTDLPRPVEIAGQVNTLKVTSGALAGEVELIEWTLCDPTGFVADVTGRLGATPVSPDALRTLDDIEAFARRLRERGVAPPPVDRR